MFTTELIEQLKGKLDPKNISDRELWRGGPVLNYLEGYYVIETANKIFGFDGWSYNSDVKTVSERQVEKFEKDGSVTKMWEVGYQCVLTLKIGDVVRTDIGFGNGIDKNLAISHESAGKEAVTDALKRAFRTFGDMFGNCIYDKEWRAENINNPAPAAKTYTSSAVPAKQYSAGSTTDLASDKQITYANKLLAQADKKVGDFYPGKTVEQLTKKEAGDLLNKLQEK